MTSTDSFVEQTHFSLARSQYYEEDAAVTLAPSDPPVRLIAFYLPQFHPIPENDLWWGKGFTEWTNVSKARPQFAGHYQPRLPGELGFYDLRMPETLVRQAELAKKYGIYGFCIHYYWFGGKRLLEKPLDLLLEHREIEMPFCVCWANESWTRRWDGSDSEVLIAQSHSPADDIAFARALEPVLGDPRYIRIDGRPVLIVYRPGLLPEPLATARRWRSHFARVGLGDPYLVMAESFGDQDPRLFGFDATVEFPPHRLGADAPPINEAVKIFDPTYEGNVRDYAHLVRRGTEAAPAPYRLFPAVCPSWDNEARRPGKGYSFAFSTPAKYGSWLQQACRRAAREVNPAERLVFVNAWNEWGEAAYLEPDRHFGYAYLNETARVLAHLDLRQPPAVDQPRIVIVVHDAHIFGAQLIALHLIELLVQQFGVQVHVLLGGSGALEDRFRGLAPTERFEGGFANLDPWRSAASRLTAQGFTTALCNTLVSAQLIELLGMAGLSCICLVHELPTLMRQYMLEAAARIAARQAHALVFPSVYVRDRFTAVAGPIAGNSLIRPQGLYMIPAPYKELGRLRELGRSQLGVPSIAPIVLGAGGGDLRKGVDLWPALMRGVLARHADAFFVWVGRIEPDLLAWIRHDLEATGHADRLVLPGVIDDMKPIYAAADVFLLTSREDPFPSVVLEAMAHGLPTVAFENSGGIVELLRASGNLLVPYLDIEAMADALCRLLEDATERSATGEAGRLMIERDFNYADYGFDLLRLMHPALRKISVIVPNYNYARYLRQRLESIWSQTYPVYEVVVLDDASTDNSAAVIAELQRTSGRRFSIVCNEVNSGSVSRQWARGVELTRGELVWIAEADDFADPGFLAETVKAFDEPETVLSYCQSRQVDETGAVLAETYLDYVQDVDPQLWQHDYRRPGIEEIADALTVKNTIPNVSAVLLHRDALMRVLGEHLDEMTGFRNCADWFCYLRLLSGGSVAFTAKSLNNHRRHQGSVTLAPFNRRHLDEILALQRLAAEVTMIRPEKRNVAQCWRESVACQFGLNLEKDDTVEDAGIVGVARAAPGEGSL